MIDINQFTDAPSVRKALKGLTAKVARMNMALKKAKGTEKEAAAQAKYDEVVADREALRAKLKDLTRPCAAEEASEG